MSVGNPFSQPLGAFHGREEAFSDSVVEQALPANTVTNRATNK